MNNQPIRSILALGTIFSFRMLGLFMILPVFAVYAEQLHGSTPTLIGLALGIYGLTQALLQMPLGFLSDRYGRKLIITIGLLIFALGSVIAALSSSIEGVIIGRAIQGAGAVGSTILALVGDLTAPEQRTKAMATIGVMIAFAFILAMVLGPILDSWVHVSGIFWLTAVLGVLGIGVLYVAVPSVSEEVKTIVPSLATFKTVLSQPNLLRLNFSIGALHAILTANFVVIPFALRELVSLPQQHEWMVYLSLLLIAFVLMLPGIIIGEKRGIMPKLLIGAILVLGISQIILAASYDLFWGLIIGMLILFTAFNLLEASLPSLISRLVTSSSRGTAMGVYSSCQFLGIFIGGSVGGWMYGKYGLTSVFIFTAVLTLLWIIVAWGMRNLSLQSSK